MLTLPAEFPQRHNPLPGLLGLWVIIEQLDVSTDDVEDLLEDDGMATSLSSDPAQHHEALRARASGIGRLNAGMRRL